MEALDRKRRIRIGYPVARENQREHRSSKDGSGHIMYDTGATSHATQIECSVQKTVAKKLKF
jgi:hypothetical protein